MWNNWQKISRQSREKQARKKEKTTEQTAFLQTIFVQEKDGEKEHANTIIEAMK